MSKDLIRYDLQVQDALRGVVRKVLADAARDGLPGDHHFYITFRTHAPGVKLSNRLREQYPEEMTIILQYQFWDLKVDEIGFEVGLHFKNVPERLIVPFEAIAGFYDPSVQFGLKFEAQAEGDEDDDSDEEAIEFGPVANPPRPVPREAEKPRGAESKATAAEKSDEPAEADEKAGDEGAKIVSIDAFRKKT
ncbi:hypothetical protein GJ654_14660 [Rhodoblastus acidophilus]|uniref:Stringent starvation protein B n=1 Tax=Rhodoblastus acidophilus TaxID=1074 RepID=A0A6N8DP28_RHOAC|nr:ClpXP protease specificity-enhancing factor SspB [Rhodoblastus acidophilus]MCW2275262.1 hypothetical protein [Rhodoblastus acidophilus]MTV32229.1 hypothetical protein [Rhodoblastus acidophilus]